MQNVHLRHRQTRKSELEAGDYGSSARNAHSQCLLPGAPPQPQGSASGGTTVSPRCPRVLMCAYVALFCFVSFRFVSFRILSRFKIGRAKKCCGIFCSPDVWPAAWCLPYMDGKEQIKLLFHLSFCFQWTVLSHRWSSQQPGIAVIAFSGGGRQVYVAAWTTWGWEDRSRSSSFPLILLAHLVKLKLLVIVYKCPVEIIYNFFWCLFAPVEC